MQELLMRQMQTKSPGVYLAIHVLFFNTIIMNGKR